MVSPERLEEYLRSHDWKKYHVHGHHSIWDHGTALPLAYVPTRDFQNYAEMIADTLLALVAAERRPSSAILFDLLPVPARRQLVLHLFPQLAEVLLADPAEASERHPEVP
jgi:hypothetical protein